jgi:hypothetical protein
MLPWISSLSLLSCLIACDAGERFSENRDLLSSQNQPMRAKTEVLRASFSIGKTKSPESFRRFLL